MVEFNFPTHVIYARGACSNISKFLTAERILVVTDTNVSALAFFKNIIANLKNSGKTISIFDNFSGNPLESHVIDGIQIYRKNNCQAFLAIGGGAAMDVCKAIAILVNHKEDLFAYEDAPGKLAIDAEIPMIVALPTTAGTGSEVGRSAVIGEDKTHIKRILFSPSLLARHVILDADLTQELPAKITAYTGIDAFTHLLEAYLSRPYHPMCDGIALEGLKLVQGSLLACYNQIQDPQQDHRGNLLLAATMGGIAFQKGLGANHSCAHALSTVVDLHHGLANAIMLPYVMQFNRRFAAKRFGQIEQALSLEVNDGHSLLQYIDQLLLKLDISVDLKDYGIKEGQIEELTEIAIHDVCHSLNPVDVSREQFEKFFKQAYSNS